MRTTFLSQGRQALFNLRQAQARKIEGTNEISSGLRVSKPSDSPADAAGIVRTRRELSVIAQFRANLERVQGELEVVDGVLSQVGLLLNRALSLAAQGATDTQDAGGRALIAGEMEVIFRRLAAAANTTHGGRFVFSGAADDTRPFELDPDSPDGVVYRGDSVSRSVTFPDGRPGQVALPGIEIFLRPDSFTGSGRTAYASGSAAPDPPVAIGIAFSGGLDEIINVDLDGFFVAAAPPGVPAGGEQITVNFTSNDGEVASSITTAALSGGETAAQIADALNAAIAANEQLAGGFTFSDAGGVLKLTESDAPGVGFSFTSSATGGLVTGLESGGSVGGQSAQEIAAALNEQVAASPALAAANVGFSAVGGEVHVDGDVDFTFTAIDFNRGTEFASGLAGTHVVGGARSANIFRVVRQLVDDLNNNNRDGITQGVTDLQRSVEHLGGSQGFYGGTLRQVDTTLETLTALNIVSRTRLSDLQDADMIDSINKFLLGSSAEQFALQVMARRQPTLLDLLA